MKFNQLRKKIVPPHLKHLKKYPLHMKVQINTQNVMLFSPFADHIQILIGKKIVCLL